MVCASTREFSSEVLQVLVNSLARRCEFFASVAPVILVVLVRGWVLSCLAHITTKYSKYPILRLVSCSHSLLNLRLSATVATNSFCSRDKHFGARNECTLHWTQTCWKCTFKLQPRTHSYQWLPNRTYVEMIANHRMHGKKNQKKKGDKQIGTFMFAFLNLEEG